MAHIEAHMPPQAIPDEDDPVWGNTWNPDTNEWAPSSEQHSTFGVAEPSHGDEMYADPMSDDPGNPHSTPPDSAGTVADARMNLLDHVRHGDSPAVLPTQRVEHYVETHEVGGDSELIRTRQVQIGAALTQLLEQSDDRKRALVRIQALTAAATTVAVGNPAAGSDWTATVPAGQTWTLQSIVATLTASATVANRGPVQIRITLPGGAATPVSSASAVQTASQVVTYVFSPGTAPSAAGGPLPPNLVLPAGTVIASSTANIQAGDQWSGISLVVSQTATAIPVFVQGRAIGGSAAAAGSWVQLNAGDPPLEVKSTCGLDAVAPAAGTGVVVMHVYEEVQGKAPGLV